MVVAPIKTTRQTEINLPRTIDPIVVPVGFDASLATANDNVLRDSGGAVFPLEVRGELDRARPFNTIGAGPRAMLAYAGENNVGTGGTTSARPAKTGINAASSIFDETYKPASDVNVQLGKGGAIISAEGVERFRVTRGSGGQHYDAKASFASGDEVTVRFGKPSDPLKVRVNGGDWRELPALPEGHVIKGLHVAKNGDVEITSEPRRVQDPINDSTPGPLISKYQQDGTGWKETKLDFTTQAQRKHRINEGAKQLGKGDASSFERIDRAYAERLAHDETYISKGNFATKEQAERILAAEYGSVVGKQVADLHVSGKTKEAETLQAEYMRRLYSADGPFKDTDARSLAMNAYAKQLLNKGDPAATQLLPKLQPPKGGNPPKIYLAADTYQSLEKLADSRLAANDRAGALALFQAAAKAETGGAQQLLDGNLANGDTLYLMSTKDGKGAIALGDMGSSGGGEVRAFAERKVLDSESAAVRARQIVFSEAWKQEATKLRDAGKLKITDAELDQIPPAPEVMQKYFAAKYDGKMPKELVALQKELGEYLKAAYVHPNLDVPETVTGWKSDDLAIARDGRIVADCFVMNRGVAHMLAGIEGLEIRPLEADGHTRLMVTASDGQGFVQSNEYVAKLEGKGTDYQKRAELTIEKNGGLQVLEGMPAPVVVGEAFATGAKLTDVDKAYDTSRNKASNELLSLKGERGKLRDHGRKVSDLLHRFDAFRQRAHDSYVEYYNTDPSKRAALEPKRQELAKEHAALEKDLKALKNMPDSLEAFVKKESTDTVNGNFFIYQDAADFLKAKTAPVDPTDRTGSPFELHVIRAKVKA